MATLDEERLKMKTLIESFIEREEEEDMIHIPRRHIGVITDNECDPHVQMRFKIHSVKEIYSDLQMYYDSQEDLVEFTLRKPATVQYYALFQQLYAYFGFKGDAQLYYRNPAPGINPATALIKIDGQEDIDKMVDAHAHKRTKICFISEVLNLKPSENDEF